MPGSARLISRNRLTRIPAELRLAHEHSYFLHDQCAHLLVQYEAARAHIVTVKFRSKVEAKAFADLAETDSIAAMRATGYPDEARRVILNTITMAMVSDCLHHLFEALHCMEKRKTVVALNLLRKPLTDSLMYLSWMLADEDAFYAAFASGDPRAISPKQMGNHRATIIQQALDATGVKDVLTADFVGRTIFDRRDPYSLYRLFQHAVHLVTVQHVELQTEPENFNFIFKSYSDDDIYHSLYEVLPQLLLYLSHVILELFDRIKPMDPGAKRAFTVRSILGLYLVEGGENEQFARRQLAPLAEIISCPACTGPIALSAHNAARMVLTETCRCTACRRVHDFPFSWLF